MPDAAITAPAANTVFGVGDEIQFDGSCSDIEDGVLSGASLVWSSDLNGPLGTGETLSSTHLSPGTHHITLMGIDAQGNEGTQAVTIVVDAVGATPAGLLPDTGQTTSYTDLFGEDSDYTINPPSYTKLDANANDLDDSATSWTMVRDNVTGLIWEVKTNDGGIHDANDLYRWTSANDQFIAQLDSDNFGGFSDWRLPTAKELSNLVDRDSYQPTINTTYFPNTSNSKYMTSHLLSAQWDYALPVEFGDGHILTLVQITGGASVRSHVRAVRGQQLSSNFVDYLDGTVTDTTTGLMWQQAESGGMEWDSALNYCESLSLAGHDDWRLPNTMELQSMADYGNTPGGIATFFPGIQSIKYWSSTGSSQSPSRSVSVSLDKGDVYIDGIRASLYWVRCVRNGL